VLIIDEFEYRLQRAKEAAPGVETINFSERKTLDALHDMVPNGPDCSIEAVGFHYAHSIAHKIEMKLMMETDPAEIINEIIYATRKGGYIGIVGVYAGFCNHFNIGAFMEKGLHMAAGQTPCQSFWKKLLGLIQEGKLRPQAVISHIMPLKEASRGYEVFNAKRDTDKCMKVVLRPDAAQEKFIPTANEAMATFS
jgi:threonine dehydrogenase-like Zn-dependent dehydrogenase